MCTTQQNYDLCGVEMAPTDMSSDESFCPDVCSRLLIAPSLNAILQGTLAPADNISEIENKIWYPETPETFLHASLQFLESRLHSRIFETAPTPSGKVVLSDGFVFSPIYPGSSHGLSSEAVMKVHNFSDHESSSWFRAVGRTPRVASVMYSCVSIPGEHNSRSTSDWKTRNYSDGPDRAWEEQRDVGIQTSADAFISVQDPSTSMVSDEDTTPIGNFSEYVQYCHSIVNPPSQLFNFGQSSSKQKPNFKIYDEATEYNVQSIGDTLQPTDDDYPETARTYLSHYRPSSGTQVPESASQNTTLPCNDVAIHRQSAEITASNTTMSSVKSVASNQTDAQSSTASTKSVYYYARISASFFSFLNRATQRLKNEKLSGSRGNEPRGSSATTSTLSVSKPRVHRSKPSENEEPNAKLTLLSRFMNVFGGSKTSKEYDKVKNPSGTISTVIDIRTGIFDDDVIFEYGNKEPENRERSCTRSSISTPGKRWKSTSAEESANALSSVKSVGRKEFQPPSVVSRKLPTKPKTPRHLPRDRSRDEEQHVVRSPHPHDLAVQQKYVESCFIPHVKKKPSTIISSLLGSKTSSRTLCDDIMKLPLEGDSIPFTKTPPPGSCHECCMCYTPPDYTYNNDPPPEVSRAYHQTQGKQYQAVFCSTNEYFCYSSVPENDDQKSSYTEQQTDKTEKVEQQESKNTFFKPFLRRGQSARCNKREPKLSSLVHGKLILKPKPPVLGPPSQHSYTTSTQSHVSEARLGFLKKNAPFGKLILKPKPPVLGPSSQHSCTTSTQSHVSGARLGFLKKNAPFGKLILKPKPPVLGPPSQHSCTTSTQSRLSGARLGFLKKNAPLIRKPNTYLIEKPQVFPDKITRLVSDDKKSIWSGCSTTSNLEHSTTGTHSMSSQKYRSDGLLNTVSTSSSENDYPVSVKNNTVSHSSRSSFWLPTKRLACDSRDFPVKPTFSKEVIKLFQRSPKSSKR